jgi:serine phosphatase RsbU (regulator of sigma subunit)
MNANDTAISYYQRALAIMEKMQHNSGVALSLIEIAQAHNKKGEKDKAQEYATRSLAIAKTVGFPPRIEQAARLLHKLFAAKGDYKNAYEMFQLSVSMRDSIQNENNRKAAYKQQINYEFEKKEAIAKQEQELNAYRQFWIQVICVIIFVGLITLAFIMYRRYKSKKRTSEQLEQKNKIIEDKNKDITDSINYAKRIQDAMLPAKEIKYKIFPEAFVLFAPKYVVSGDFYWFCEKNGKRLIAAVDCTGHGVPGAFMSMIGNAFLNEIVIQKGITEPGQILSELRYKVIEALKQKGAEGETRDGMDMALLSFEPNGTMVEFAGANNPVWISRHENGKYRMEEVMGDKRPIGFFRGQGLPFTNHRIKLSKGDTVYVFTDGYADQFGGPKGKKFKYKQLQELLLSIQERSMQEQEAILTETLNSWKGGLEQIDDILVIGVRV